jgi:FkbM family methyltransferase
VSFGLDGMDRALLPHVGPHPGTFIEAGAYDGLTQSNTALLEFSYGWRGLLVEPVPELAERCAANRPASVVEQAALVPPDHEGEHISMTYCNRSSIVQGARGGPDEDAAWIETCRALPDQRDIEPRRLTVRARTLSSILDERGIGRIDLLSLDLEGYEAPALRGLDLERHRPRLLLVEISNDRDAVESVIEPWYAAIAELSDHRDEEPGWYDVLYRLRDRKVAR